MHIQLRLNGLPYLIKIVGLAALYFVAAKIGLQFATVGQNVTLVWPPAGLAVAALILSKFKLWPGVALGAFLVHATTGFFLPEVCMVTVGNTLEAVVAAYLLQRLVGFHPGFDRARDVLGFVVLAVLFSPIIAAMLGTLSLMLNGDIISTAAPMTALTWWAGDAMGILIVAPPLLIWLTQREIRWTRSQIIEASIITVSVVVLSVVVFRIYVLEGNSYPLAHLTFPFLIWVALRFGQRGTSSIALLVSAIAVWGTSQQAGPFARPTLNESELFLSSFIVVETISSMLLAAVLAQTKHAEAELVRERDFATQVMNQLGQGVAVTSSGGHYDFVNAAYGRMLGYSPEELIGKPAQDVTLPEDNPLREQAYRQRLAGQSSTYEMRLRRADGSPVHTLISGTPRWENGQVKGGIAVITDLTVQKKTENALRESQARLQTAIENFPFQLWATDADGRYVLQSPLSIQRRGSFLGKRLDDIEDLPEETREEWQENNRRLMAGEILRGETTYPVDGEERSFYYTKSPIRDGDAIIGMLGVEIDITDLKRAEQALKKNEETNRAFLERLKALQEVSIELSKAEKLDELSLRAVELGRSKLKFDRLGIWLVHEDMVLMTGTFGTDENGLIRDERSQTLPFDLSFYPTEGFRDGNVRLYFNEDAPLYDDQHRVIGRGWSALASVQDGSRIIGTISTDNLVRRQPLEDYQVELLVLYANTLGHLFARKRAEQALQQSEARFRSVFEGASLGIAVIDRAGFPISLNPKYIEMMGYSEDELRSMSFSGFIHPDEAEHNLIFFRRLLAGEIDGYQFDKRYVRKDGNFVWVRMQVSLFPGSTPGQDFAIALTEDITERKQAEEALRQLTAELEQRVAERTVDLEKANVRLTELDRLKTKFIADVSHELRTPLAVLNTRVYLLQHSQPEKYPEYLNALKLQLERLTDFVNAILDLSRLELGAQKIAFGPINLNDTVEQVVTALSPRAEVAGLALHTQLSDSLPLVRGELNQIAQVATNLIANAVKYTPNGSIYVRTCLDESHDRAVLEVEDTGVGINPDDQTHLFERFYRGESTGQSNIPGSGLGLSIVKEIVDLHSGEIHVKSEVGKGTLFRVSLPVWPD